MYVVGVMVTDDNQVIPRIISATSFCIVTVRVNTSIVTTTTPTVPMISPSTSTTYCYAYNCCSGGCDEWQRSFGDLSPTFLLISTSLVLKTGWGWGLPSFLNSVSSSNAFGKIYLDFSVCWEASEFNMIFLELYGVYWFWLSAFIREIIFISVLTLALLGRSSSRMELLLWPRDTGSRDKPGCMSVLTMIPVSRCFPVPVKPDSITKVICVVDEFTAIFSLKLFISYLGELQVWLES